MTEQPPPGYGYDPAPVAAGRPGELLDRFLARLIDGILLGIVGYVIATVLIAGAIMGAGNGIAGQGMGFAASAVVSVVTTLIYLGYFAFMESSRGQTVGKMLMKLKTVGPTGVNPTLEQAIRRNIFMATSLLGIIPVLGFLAGPLGLIAAILIAVGINGDTVNRQAWHDHFAGGTRVLKIG
jgi:uncharacterized RDD family membrane protein YckC